MAKQLVIQMKKSNWHGGKGSGRRSSQDDSKYADNWDLIFGKKKKEDKNGKNNTEDNKKQSYRIL